MSARGYQVADTSKYLSLHIQRYLFLLYYLISQVCSQNELKSLNSFHLCLQVTTLVDVISGYGKFLINNSWYGWRDSTLISPLTLPRQGRPSYRSWTTWSSKLGPLIFRKKGISSTLLVHIFHQNRINPGVIITILLGVLSTKKYHPHNGQYILGMVEED